MPEAACSCLSSALPGGSQQRDCCVQDRIEQLLKYYAVTTLSMRDSLHGLLAAEPWLAEKLWPKDDNAHPTCIGSRCMLLPHDMPAVFRLYLVCTYSQALAKRKPWAMANRVHSA